MKGRWIPIVLSAFFLSGTILLPFPVQAKVIVKNFEELKEVLECEQKKEIELGADIPLLSPITIRGYKTLDGKHYTLRRGKKKGLLYGGTLFLMMGVQCEWKNVTISGAGNSSGAVKNTFGRLLEARRGRTVIGAGSVWERNVNRNLAVDGGGAIWVQSGAQCIIDGGQLSNNENVSCGAGVRIEKGGRMTIYGGKIIDNRVRGAGAVKGFEGLGAAIYNEGELKVMGGVIKGNRVIAYSNDGKRYGGAGGALYNRGICAISGGFIRDNYASQRGGAIYTERHSVLEISGGNIEANRDDEERPVWLAGSCMLGKSALIRQLYIASSANVTVKKNWKSRKQVVVEPHSYKKGLCLLRGGKGDFVLKTRTGWVLKRQEDGYYIEKREEKKAKKKNVIKGNSKKEDREPVKRVRKLPKGPRIQCERSRLVFYEGEYVTKDVLCYGVSAQSKSGTVLPVDVRGKAFQDGRLNTEQASAGSVTFCARENGYQKAEISVNYVIKENRKPTIKTAPRYLFADELKRLDKEKWKTLLWQGMSWKDDCSKWEDVIMETEVECGNLKEIKAGKYIIKGCVRDQYGHRYYMKLGEKRRYGRGKEAPFTITITVVERRAYSKENPMPQMRFSPVLQTEKVKEEWHFNREDVLAVQQFMEQRGDPFSQETNQEFMRRFEKNKRRGVSG